LGFSQNSNSLSLNERKYQQRQSAIAMRGGPDIFRQAGVPGVKPSARFPDGGVVPAGQDGDIVIQEPTLDVHIGMGFGAAEKIFVIGGSFAVDFKRLRRSERHTKRGLNRL
jgi:hypothetical protein